MQKVNKNRIVFSRLALILILKRILNTECLQNNGTKISKVYIKSFIIQQIKYNITIKNGFILKWFFFNYSFSGKN